MPSETRLIKFADIELMTALFQYSRRRDEAAVSGLPKKVELSQEGGISATLFLSDQEPIKYDAAHVAAALILFCVKRKIPLPKNAKKTVHLQDNKTVFVLKSGKDPPLQMPS